MNSDSKIPSLSIPSALLAAIQATADEDDQPVDDVLRDVIERGLAQRRWRSEILARVDDAEAALARGEGMVITQPSMRQLGDDIKQRGRARLAAESDLIR